MASTLSLLALTSSQALQQMVQDTLVDGVTVNDLLLEAPQAGQGLAMTSTVRIASAAYLNPNWPYFGQVEFGYTALDMGQAFAGLPLRFQMPPQFTSQQLAERLGQALGIMFEPDDIFQETIQLTEPQMTYTLVAGPASVRWKGQVAIELIRKVGA